MNSVSVTPIEFWSSDHFGSSASLLWNTPLLDWRLRADPVSVEPAGLYLTTFTTALKTQKKAKVVVTFPQEWDLYKSQICRLFEMQIPVQLWVQRLSDIPKTTPAELLNKNVDWVLVPSKYDEFCNLVSAIGASSISKWNVMLIPSHDSRDAWLEPNDVVNLTLEIQQNLVRTKIGQIFVISQILTPLPSDLQDLYLNPTTLHLEYYWKTKRRIAYRIYFWARKLDFLSIPAWINLARIILLSFVQPGAVIQFYWMIRRSWLFQVLTKPYWFSAYQFRKRVLPLIRGKNEA